MGTCTHSAPVNKNHEMYSAKLVLNLSAHPLSPDQISLLQKGLNFCPTPDEPNIGEIRRDLDKFHLSLKRKSFFHRDSDSDLTTTHNPSFSIAGGYAPGESLIDDPPFGHFRFRNPSSWKPTNVSTSLEAFILCNEVELSGLQTKKHPNDNLTPGERKAIADLKALREIVIKPADKGSAVVIMDRTDYVHEGIRQLSDGLFYKKVETDLTDKHNELVKSFILHLEDEGEIDTKCKDFLTCKKPRTPKFYMLPKIHKGVTPPPGRPIVSANNSPTERISQLVDFFLNPLIPNIPSYVKDTTHFIRLIRDLGQINPNCLIATLDVSSLYTNIPNNEGLEAASNFLNRHRADAERPSNLHLVHMLNMVLTMNNFDFNGEHFLQIGGTAMGTRVAPSFANCFMGEFERLHVRTHHIKPLLWLRYIDDIFAIFDHDETTVQGFINDLNSCHPSIKFTAELSNTSVNFLDTTVKLTQHGQLETDLYCKPTDAHNYLLYNSAHPSHLKKGIPYSQFLRVRRICTHLSDFDLHASTLSQHFERRGYPPSIISAALQRARDQDRDSLIQEPLNESTTSNVTFDKLFAVSTYSPGFTGFRDVIEKNRPILAKNKCTRFLFDLPTTYGHRRAPNLRDTLVSAQLPDTQNQKEQKHGPPGARCLTRGGRPKKNCRYCTKLNKSGTILSHSTGKSHPCRTKIDCKSHNIVYAIECKRCGMQYVGHTQNTLQSRIRQHFYDMKLPEHQYPTGVHFSKPGHQKEKDALIHVLSFCPAPSEGAGKEWRLAVELEWIHRLRTQTPYGLNLDH